MSHNNLILENKRVPKKVKLKLKPIVQKLLINCLNSNAIGTKLKWEDFEDIYDALQEIQTIEKGYVACTTNRASPQCWEDFCSWCSKNGALFDPVKVIPINDDDYGLFAKKEIHEYQEFLTIPVKLMMTESSASSSKLGPLIDKDPVLQHMPNVQLSLHLLMESLNQHSFWQPYISILPSRYNTVLYFTIQELKDLKGSQVLDEVLKLYCSVARQYCYFFQLFQSDSSTNSLNIGQYFTYDLYRWAVSTVMTRQNSIPVADGKFQAALIPLFDMCNHANGKLSTDFNFEKKTLVSYAFQHFSCEKEVRMFYGPRTNAEFFLHNAFVYSENENDATEIKLGISKSDLLFARKINVLSKLGFETNETFKLRKAIPVSDRLLLFLKINGMKADELDGLLELDVDAIHSTVNESEDFTKRALSFLKDRTYLLLKSYKNSIEEDESIVTSDLSLNRRLVHQLLMTEKKILNQVYNYCVEHST